MTVCDQSNKKKKIIKFCKFSAPRPLKANFFMTLHTLHNVHLLFSMSSALTDMSHFYKEYLCYLQRVCCYFLNPYGRLIWTKIKFCIIISFFCPLEATGKSFKSIISPPFLKLSFSLHTPIISDECHVWFHSNAASPAARNTEQVNMTKIAFIVGFDPSNGKETTLYVHRLNCSTTTSLL